MDILRKISLQSVEGSVKNISPSNIRILRSNPSSFNSAVGLLKLRIKTIKQSGTVLNEQAKAQSSVIATLIRREDARVGNEIAGATKKDSSDMKVIAIMTMAFLPATFFAALFDIPTLAWDQLNVITHNFWVYWAFTVPTTLLVFFTWDVLNEWRMYKWLGNLSLSRENGKPSKNSGTRNSFELPNYNFSGGNMTTIV
ncbi:hypothetical protein F4677DRAFT_384350 [Hypoxylon crocopeplum]|nr:hypothetical protein F4677DRAFT_384350 [Hypoxylon crocopeplum]